MQSRRVLVALALCAVLAVAVDANHHRLRGAHLVHANYRADPAELEYQITVGSDVRTFYLYVPAAYNTSKVDWPLMVFFHGATDACTSGANFMIAGYTELQAERQFLLATGCGINKVWKGPLDLPFAEAILDSVTGKYRVDTARIYGSGFSNGAGLIEYLGCRIPGRFTGLAIAAGWVMDDTFPSNATNRALLEACDSLFAKAQTTVQVLKLQGTIDPSVEPYGRTSVPSMRDDIYGWALRNGCKGSPTTAHEDSVYKDERFENCPANVTVRLLMLYGIPHQWVHDSTFNYNTEILDNFHLVAPAANQHPRASHAAVTKPAVVAKPHHTKLPAAPQHPKPAHLGSPSTHHAQGARKIVANHKH